jgi:hypothetical protein
MVNRLYILLDIVDGKADKATKIVRKSPGVVIADALEGPPDVVIVLEAAKRRHLAKLAMQVLASVESLTENVCLLPSQGKLKSHASTS